jgi:hypothetical protein
MYKGFKRPHSSIFLEANPHWGIAFGQVLLALKPPHVSYLLGTASEFVGVLHSDIALFCTHSGVQDLQHLGAQFAPEVIDVYGEMILDAPAHFDAGAVLLRPQA